MVSADDHSAGKIEDAARNWACALQSSGEYTAQRPLSLCPTTTAGWQAGESGPAYKHPVHSTRTGFHPNFLRRSRRTAACSAISSGYWHHPVLA